MLRFNWFNMMHTFVVKLHLWLCAQVPVSLRELLAHLGTGPSGPSDENLRITSEMQVRRSETNEREWRETRQSCFGNKTSCRASSLEPPAWATTFLRAASGPSELYPPEREGGKKATIRTFDTCWLMLTHWLHLLAAKTQKNYLKKSIGEKTLGSVFKVG